MHKSEKSEVRHLRLFKFPVSNHKKCLYMWLCEHLSPFSVGLHSNTHWAEWICVLILRNKHLYLLFSSILSPHYSTAIRYVGQGQTQTHRCTFTRLNTDSVRRTLRKRFFSAECQTSSTNPHSVQTNGSNLVTFWRFSCSFGRSSILT